MSADKARPFEPWATMNDIYEGLDMGATDKATALDRAVENIRSMFLMESDPEVERAIRDEILAACAENRSSHE